MCFFEDRAELFAGRHAGNIPLRISALCHILNRSDTDHKKLIQIRCRNGQEIQPFHQWILTAPGFHQTPSVKLQPGKFPVDIKRRIAEEVISAVFCFSVFAASHNPLTSSA